MPIITELVRLRNKRDHIRKQIPKDVLQLVARLNRNYYLLPIEHYDLKRLLKETAEDDLLKGLCERLNTWSLGPFFDFPETNNPADPGHPSHVLYYSRRRGFIIYHGRREKSFFLWDEKITAVDERALLELGFRFFGAVELRKAIIDFTKEERFLDWVCEGNITLKPLPKNE